ncbi:MAG: hypothetical protein U0869_02155 [Chloroflexota bacterium]
MAQVRVAAIEAWLDRVPRSARTARPEPGALADRIRSWWLPEQPVVYVGRSNKSLGARVGALYATATGDRRPHSGGHWLKVLRNRVDGLRIWWAETPAPEEYEDAVVTAIAETVTAAERARAAPERAAAAVREHRSVTGEKRARPASPARCSTTMCPRPPRLPPRRAGAASGEARRLHGSQAFLDHQPVHHDQPVDQHPVDGRSVVEHHEPRPGQGGRGGTQAGHRADARDRVGLEAIPARATTSSTSSAPGGPCA